MKPSIRLAFTLTAIYSCFFGLAQQKQKDKAETSKTQNPNVNTVRIQSISPLDTLLIEKIVGLKGKSNNGEYKISIPQNDLSIEVDGFKIIPAMGLTTWIDFAPTPQGAMLMGDLVLSENDLKPVQQEVIKQGLTITAIHNHFVRNHPNVMYMHVGGSGSTEAIATKAKAVLDKIKENRGNDPSKGNSSSESVSNSLNMEVLDNILKYKGEMTKGVYKYTIGRPDVLLREHGVPVTSFMGFNTWAAFQGTPDHAAVAGDFTMTEVEVAPVIKTLIENGIEVVAVHNHMVHEQPRIFFLHYWGVGNVQELVKGLRAALDQTGKKNSMQGMDMSGNNAH
jgi:hypothetical protein